MFSAKQEAEKLGVSDIRISVLLSERRIKGKKLGHDWVVTSLNYQQKRKAKRSGK